MNKILCGIFTLLSFSLLHAQYKVQFILKEKKAIQHDSIYVTGSFSNWDSTLADNGNRIPAAIKEKIFQPFFTTEPTGQGTGLGLSLSYDIAKAHGGELKAESKLKEQTTFTIQLPINV